jgi:xylan 1,4-beta-xylosidase
MLGLLGNQRLKVTSSAALPKDEIVRSGVRTNPDINAIAARKENNHEAEILLWNYHDDDVAFPASPVDLTITGLPVEAKRALLEHFRVDGDHSNAFAVWKAMGSPQSLSPEQSQRLQSAGELQLLNSPAWVTSENGAIHLHFDLPRQALSLIRLSW